MAATGGAQRTEQLDPDPADLVDQAKEYHELLVELASEVDEGATEAYLEGKAPTEAELKALIRKGTINNLFVPVLCGSAFKNKGVQPMLDAVVDYLPSPVDIPPIKGMNPDTDAETARSASEDEKACAPGVFRSGAPTCVRGDEWSLTI